MTRCRLPHLTKPLHPTRPAVSRPDWEKPQQLGPTPGWGQHQDDDQLRFGPAGIDQHLAAVQHTPQALNCLWSVPS